MMVRGASLALLALWSWLLIRDHWATLPARMALLMNGAIVFHVISSIPGPIHIRSAVDWIMVIGSTAVPSFFWLFARTWFNDETRIGWRSWALIAVASAVMAVSIILFQTAGQEKVAAIAGSVARASMFGFVIAGLWAAWRGRDGDLIEARRRLRSRLVWAVGLYVIIVLVLEISVYRGFAPRSVLTLIEFGAMMLTGALCAAMFVIGQADLFARTAAARAVRGEDMAPDPALAALGLRLHQHMEHERAYRDDRLTIAGLAAQLEVQEYRLRRLINGQLGHRNFAAFLNGYRLNEVKEALTDPSQRDVPILTIALDAGFGSLGPFNRAFREAEGMTPTMYRIRPISD
ncbi:MAG: helix-turn-helix domain-containing protein, partial [Chakrabartia sp.]